MRNIIKNIVQCSFWILAAQLLVYWLWQSMDWAVDKLWLSLVLGSVLAGALVSWRLVLGNMQSIQLLHDLVQNLMHRVRTAPQQADSSQVGFSQEELLRLAKANDANLSELGYWLRGLDGQLNNAQRAIVAQFKQYDKMLMNLPLPVLVFGADQRIEWLNKAALSIFGIGKENAPILDVLPDPSLPEHLNTVLNHQRTVYCPDVRLDGQQVRYFTAALSTMPNALAQAENGGINLLHNPFLDEPTPRGMMVLIEETQTRWAAERGVDFVANVSHELRTPLTSMQGFLETLKSNTLSKDDHDSAMEIMRQQTTRMVSLVEDLLILASLDEPEKRTPTSLVDLTKIIETEAGMLKGRVKERNQRLALALPDQATWVLGHDVHLAQIVQNLLDNALKYSRPKSEITARLEVIPYTLLDTAMQKRTKAFDSTHIVRLRITDQGEGIAEQHLPHLTTRFYRVDRNRSRESGGTGLGLAIVKHIVQNHQGVLDIQSELGVGSSFTIYLPSISF